VDGVRLAPLDLVGKSPATLGEVPVDHGIANDIVEALHRGTRRTGEGSSEWMAAAVFHLFWIERTLSLRTMSVRDAHGHASETKRWYRFGSALKPLLPSAVTHDRN